MWKELPLGSGWGVQASVLLAQAVLADPRPRSLCEQHCFLDSQGSVLVVTV